MRVQDLKDKKILILGFGREGKDTLLFLRKYFSKKKIGIADQKQGSGYLKKIKDYDVIIKSPGVPNWKIAPFLKKKQVVTSQTDIFFSECPGTIIGVTGTKGKSTTASMIYGVLRSGGVRAHLLGNIGEPVLSHLAKAKPEDVFVYELSSFQLENLRKSPHIAVLLNVYPEHLDHHQSHAKYAWAKARIAMYQTPTDFLIYNQDSKVVSTIAKLSKAQKLPFKLGPTKLSTTWSGQVSRPVLASVKPARIVGELFGIPKQKIERAIKNFKPLEHRLEKVGEWKGITFYNDSLATIPEATVAALDALGTNVSTLIAGGYDRGLDMKKLGERIKKSNIKTLILFPTTGTKILQSIKRPPQSFFAKDMKEAVRLAYLHTPKKKICLLSPAASSFNMFKDYKDRGEQFKKWVAYYGKRKKISFQA
ncbi:MAG: UDP-N-acetylmuramoylalanine--D-glutamate ligase [Candidatus Wildermuthbacteria bacterium RIFCSPHIGHO2_01_FULL_48_25]|uniref:UDP-N-acetylmuramoylalanine--D-glutamate ligase n=1 Tax=Candidatus Wildermuthbacteria bacterium RIFCSPLOWO2_01_FULL_48_16 TaxID=1802461 RepID=A0A1G2RJ88_9BACT|nr:MAG: UDP-N-acetylmuramoylalanine--D-glutamate ligase [Candidatus Wildermuthbacteria bacterium RIFCSPHIGHO2_01_FULL_48_25]OHA69178.1 MAG: UDP-N-acetylmuramoylalanine--D-glutamate ligase [Candidatus Wildermuthbacteria bacterium RIFCSPHIGHO2_02_FULL_49_12b]OHA72913.1 MAG: UDP-N-acetylmuramoylalanine--D-glutamate ligase [Candidatus Wildermuthbacteria bacterium RIFCSPLOWO2_01_FULL_48_16]